ncbi:MAG: AAA family ATPase, partial [Pirellulaceae bacterium]
MRIVRLECRAFGPFTNHTLEFADGRHGLHVVFGPNEAGKTSSLRALHQLLFGIPHASTDNFLHAHPDLRIGATLRRHDGAHVSFVRRKGLKNTLRAEDDVAVVSPEELGTLLPNIDEQTFRRRFGIDYDELQKGGQAVAEGKGDLAEVLFAAGAGVANLGRMLQQLEEAAQTLYTSRSTKARINKGMAAIKEARQRLQQARLPTATYLKLDEALQETRASAEQIARELAERRTHRSRLVRFDSALPLVSENLRYLQELAELADAPRLPENAAEVRAESRATIEYCRTQIERIDRELAQLVEEQQGLSVSEDLLAAGKVVESLQQRLGSHRKAAHDRVQLEAQCSELTRQAMHLKNDIHGNAGDQQLDAVQLSGRERVRIQNLGGELQKLESWHRAVEQQLHEISFRQAKAQGELDRLPRPIDATPLKRAVRAARQLGNIDERCATMRQQRARAEADLASQLQRLPLWQGDSRRLAGMPVVAAETVERWEGLWMAAEDELQRMRERESEQLSLLGDAEEHLARLSLEQDVPTLLDLDAARAERDSAWSNVRRRLASGASPERTPRPAEQGDPSNGELADRYEQSVRTADRLADRLRTEADRVAAKAALLARQQAIRQWLVEHRQALSAAADRQAEMEREWVALWQPAGISPLSPREMRGWLARFQQILTLADELRRQQDELAREDEQRAAACRQLRTALCAFGDTPPDSADDRGLQPLVEFAEEQLEEFDTQRLRREQLVANLREFSEEMPRLTAAQEASHAEWQLVRTQWEQALASLFLPPEATPAEAHEVMQTFVQLRECERGIEGLRERIHGIDADARQFREDVVSIVRQLAPDLADGSLDEAVGGLHQRWQRARQQHEQMRRVRADQTKRQQERANHLERMETAQSRLNVLLADAACQSLDELPVAEQRSARRRWCESQQQQLTEQLTRLAGHEP